MGVQIAKSEVETSGANDNSLNKLATVLYCTYITNGHDECGVISTETYHIFLTATTLSSALRTATSAVLGCLDLAAHRPYYKETNN